jgi:aspartyl-tRNA(Asn)/glutamyl-tRNA(Gln) amidotransferase subunit C
MMNTHRNKEKTMKISADDVMKVADLARLTIDNDLRDKLAVQIGNILSYVDTLEKVDTKDVVPTTHALSLFNAFREDEVKGRKGSGTEKALANAPVKEDGCFVVPRVVG